MEKPSFPPLLKQKLLNLLNRVNVRIKKELNHLKNKK